MIVLDRLTKSFGAKQVLRGVSLEVPDGQNTVIIGASGAGKSVTLKLIVGLLEPDAGAVLVDGAVVHELDRRRARGAARDGSATSSSSPRCSTR